MLSESESSLGCKKTEFFHFGSERMKEIEMRKEMDEREREKQEGKERKMSS